ncbi:MAG TPA: preprotein translocase subunit SecG [Acetobacteraceae bacterium]|nr:preprotein translocase subunit SecG [Acetobacteraceae bacterium]
MYDVLIAIHVFVTIALIGVVLIQRSEGGGLGVGTSQGMGSFMSGRGTANLLTRATAILATIFMGLSLAMAILNHSTSGVGGASILNAPMPTTSSAAPGQVGTVPAQPRPNAPPPRALPGPVAPAPSSAPEVPH